VLTLNANNIKPKCDMVLYANNLFILDWLSPNTVPIISEKNELNNKLAVQVIFVPRYILPV